MWGMKPFKILCLGFISITLFLLLSISPHTAFADDCTDAVPTDAPNLYQVNASSSSATLYFAQPASQFDAYSISYGLTQSADAYSVTFNMGRLDGAVKYTVNDIFPKTNYFFKVRANNGCASGPWSNTLGTNIKGAGSLPETGPQISLFGIALGGVALTLTGIFAFLFVL